MGDIWSYLVVFALGALFGGIGVATERAENCARIAHSKVGEERRGWLEDEVYFRAALRRLSETERERDDARQDAISIGKELATVRNEADAFLAERDALREMLAQADAAHAYEQWTIDGKGAAPMTQEEYYQRYDEARHRHRLSQKGR